MPVGSYIRYLKFCLLHFDLFSHKYRGTFNLHTNPSDSFNPFRHAFGMPPSLSHPTTPMDIGGEECAGKELFTCSVIQLPSFSRRGMNFTAKAGEERGGLNYQLSIINSQFSIFKFQLYGCLTTVLNLSGAVRLKSDK